MSLITLVLASLAGLQDSRRRDMKYRSRLSRTKWRLKCGEFSPFENCTDFQDNHKGTLYEESVEKFVEGFPGRAMREELQTPTTLLISTPLNGKTPVVEKANERRF